MAETTADRLTRLLALTAYLNERPGVPVSELAEHFGVSQGQILADVNLLWVTGTPGYLPDDLIDFAADALEEGVITLTNDRGMGRPLRLSTDEAVALLVALRALEALAGDAGVVSTGTIASASAKLRRATGAAAARAEQVDVSLPADAPARTLALAREAMRGGRHLHLRYVSAADEVTERTVDPLELLTDGSTWFLRAWCHRTAAERTFRLDRVLDARVLHAPAERLPQAAGSPGSPPAGAPEPRLGDDLPLVHLRLAPQARWVVERVPVERVENATDGTLTAWLRVADPAWLSNLLLSLGPTVLDVDPPVADAVARAEAALRAYEGLS